MSVSPEDAELLASRRFSTEELARIFGVPPPLAGNFERSTFTNSETAERWLAKFTLTPWVRKLETLFNRALLGAPLTIEFDLSGLLRGDPAQRWAAYDIARKNNILSVNEIRFAEGYNPIPGGDVITAPAGGAP